MAFCTQCGTQVAPEARCCNGCGHPMGGAAGAAVAPAIQPLAYTIHGDNLQVARIHIRPGEEIFADAGRMVYKTANVEWETRMTGATVGEKLLSAFRRSITRESLFVT